MHAASVQLDSVPPFYTLWVPLIYISLLYDLVPWSSLSLWRQHQWLLTKPNWLLTKPYWCYFMDRKWHGCNGTTVVMISPRLTALPRGSGMCWNSLSPCSLMLWSWKNLQNTGPHHGFVSLGRFKALIETMQLNGSVAFPKLDIVPYVCSVSFSCSSPLNAPSSTQTSVVLRSGPCTGALNRRGFPWKNRLESEGTPGKTHPNPGTR